MEHDSLDPVPVMGEDNTLEGLAKVWESDADIRRAVLKGGNLLKWPRPKNSGCYQLPCYPPESKGSWIRLAALVPPSRGQEDSIDWLLETSGWRGVRQSHESFTSPLLLTNFFVPDKNASTIFAIAGEWGTCTLWSSCPKSTGFTFDSPAWWIQTEGA